MLLWTEASNFFLFFEVLWPLTVVASPVAEHRLRTRRLSGHGSRAQPLCGMWDLPGPGHEPVSPASAGRVPTTAPPGKPLHNSFDQSSPRFTAISVTETRITGLCPQVHHVWMWWFFTGKSTGLGWRGVLVSRGRNLAHSLLFKPGALAQGWVFLEEQASVSRSNKCRVWDSCSPVCSVTREPRRLIYQRIK